MNRKAYGLVARLVSGILAGAVVVGAVVAQAPVALAADSNAPCSTVGGLTSIPVSRTVGATYTILNTGSTFACAITLTSGSTGTVGWTSSAVGDTPASNPTTLAAGATLTVTMLQAGTQTIQLAANSGYQYVFTVTQATPAFTAANPPTSASANTAYAGYVFSASGGGVSFAVASGSLPPGLTLASNGTLSGTPTTAGTYTFTVSATNSQGAVTSSSITIVVSSSGGGASGTEVTPAPWLQSYGRPAGAPCRYGWHGSWAEWAVSVTGGWVCNRTVFWSDGSWRQNPDAVWGATDSAQTSAWDGE